MSSLFSSCFSDSSVESSGGSRKYVGGSRLTPGSQGTPIEIEVQSLGGSSFVLNMHTGDVVLDLKTRIEQRTGTNWSR
jgi:hypothetical protein